MGESKDRGIPSDARLLASVRRLTDKASAGTRPFELADQVAEEVVGVLDAEACAIFRFDADELVMVGGWAAEGGSMFVRGARFPLAESHVSREIVRTGRPARIADYTHETGAGPRRVERLGYGTVIGAPVFVDGRLWGSITAASTQSDRLPAGSEEQLGLIAGLCSVTIALGENLALLESSAAEQAALLRVSRSVLELADPAEVFEAIVEEAARLVSLTRGALFRFDDGGGTTLIASWDAAGEPLAEPVDSVAHTVRETDDVVRVGDSDPTADAHQPVALGLPLGFGAPIHIEGRPWGAIVVAGGVGAPVQHDAGERLARCTQLSGLAIARIQARVALIEQLVETEQFAALVELSDDFIAIADLDGACLYVNRGGRRLLGIETLEEARSYSILDFLTPERVVASVEVEQPAVLEHGSWKGESTLRHFVTGEAIPVSVNSFLVTHPVTGAPHVLATVQRDLRERKRAEEQLRERADEVEQLASARRFLLVEVLRAEERLRRQLGDALHDQVLQELLAARQDLAESGQDADAVGRARTALDAASRQLREVVHDLHPAVSWTRDLESRLVTILEQSAQRGGFEWRLDFTAGETGDLGELVLAVVRELTQNAVKHAEASLVSVTVRDEGGSIYLDVSDDGRGMPPERPVEALREGHIGLASTRERVDAIGGSFEIESRPGAGTRIRVVVPRTGIAELPRDRDVE